ncbi:MAG: YdcF family protein [Octadecabacter sp.]
MFIWTLTWSEPKVGDLDPVDAIVCLAAGLNIKDELGIGSLGRVDRCVELYDAGLGPVVVFTGGTARPGGPSSAHQMGLYAQSLGLPADAVVEEVVAQSTLQNALFTLALSDKMNTIILVTDAFHLPRSKASFRWAAWQLGVPQPEIILVMSQQVRRYHRVRHLSRRILWRESVAIWFNIARASAYSIVPFATTDWLH